MSAQQERILLVENDPEISDLIARQTLKPSGYRVKVVSDAPRAIQEAIQFNPDAMIVNLNMPGLSGKDLLVALSSQGLSMPVIVIAEQGMEGDVIQAFRLGASDYLSWPIREAEVLSAVERSMKQVRAKYEREALARKLESTNRELQSRVRELTTIFGIGKAVTSITDPRALFDKIIEGAMYVTEAEKGWLLLRKGNTKTFLLSALRNMPKSIMAKLNQPWDDGISWLVALSGETLSIHGTPINRFKVSQLGKAALVVPVKIQKEVVGLMVVMREKPQPFSPSSQTLLEALADYASISLVNVRLFQAVEDRARSLQKAVETSKASEHFRSEILENIGKKIKLPLDKIEKQLEVFIRGGENLNSTQRGAIQIFVESLNELKKIVDALTSMQKAITSRTLVTIDLVDLARQAISRQEDAARVKSVKLNSDLPSNPVLVRADLLQINQVFDVLLDNAIRFSPGSEVKISVEVRNGDQPHVAVTDSGPGIAKMQLSKIFQPFYRVGVADGHHGLGIGLSLAQEIIKAHNGQIWVESSPGSGSVFHFTLRAPK